MNNYYQEAAMTTMRTLIAVLICATCAFSERTNRVDGQAVRAKPQYPDSFIGPVWEE